MCRDLRLAVQNQNGYFLTARAACSCVACVIQRGFLGTEDNKNPS